MTWEEIKKTYPIGHIQEWIVKRFPPYPLLLDDNNLGIDAVLNIIHLPGPPFKHPQVGDMIKCIVIDHSPVDRKVRLSALMDDLLRT
jgi:ribosomal protein S1